MCYIHGCMHSFGFYKILFHDFVILYTACLLCIWCYLHASSSHIANLFLQHIVQCCTSPHSLVLHVLRCPVNVNHYHYQSSIVCESTLRDSTYTTLRGCVLPCNCIEYYVIGNITPMGPE